MKSRKHVRDSRSALLAGIGVPEKTEFIPDPFQVEAIGSLRENTDTLVVAPTGTGKTYIALEGIREALECGHRAVYTAPLKALSNAKYAEFRKYYEPTFRVGLLTGDRKIETDANVVVATTEIYRNDLYSARADYSLVVLDEIHYLADPQRGPVWEESIILSPQSATLLMLSASISNPHEIASWIQDVRQRPVNVIKTTERPVELRFGFLHPELGVIPLADERGKLSHEVSRCYATGAFDDKRRFGGRGGRRGGGR